MKPAPLGTKTGFLGSFYLARNGKVPINFLLSVFILFCVCLTAARAEDNLDVFGSRESGKTGLIGIIYDLKQTQKREPSGVGPDDYFQIVKEFLTKDWDESVLNRYFRAAQPLYTTQIFIPMMSANAAPKAFGVENIIKPSVWVVHYKGQVSPPEDGTYRFLCFSDDMIAVAINGKTVCQGSLSDHYLDEVWKKPDQPTGPRSVNGDLIKGDWIDLKKDTPVDLDVIIGERPGGGFCAFMLYEKQGAIPTETSQTLYPVFQLAPYDIPAYPEGNAPIYLKENKYWKGYQ